MVQFFLLQTFYYSWKMHSLVKTKPVFLRRKIDLTRHSALSLQRFSFKFKIFHYPCNYKSYRCSKKKYWNYIKVLKLCMIFRKAIFCLKGRQLTFDLQALKRSKIWSKSSIVQHLQISYLTLRLLKNNEDISQIL